MLYRRLADVVLVVHFAFILFVILGGWLVVRWPRLAWLHVPMVLWGALIEFTGGVCPLTPLEIALQRRGGEAGYAGGFIERYLAGLIYPGSLSRTIQLALGACVVLINAAFYGRLLRRRRAEDER